jgi:hypothetical protein
MRFALITAACALSLAAATGCSTPIASMTVASTKATDFGQPHTRAASQASASDGRIWITILPLGGAPSINHAMDELLTKYNGDYLTDVKIEDSNWTLLVISGGSISVKGDVWASTPKAAPAPTAP